MGFGRVLAIHHAVVLRGQKDGTAHRWVSFGGFARLKNNLKTERYVMRFRITEKRGEGTDPTGRWIKQGDKPVFCSEEDE